jgi:RimJ/RimL family protein N-acetyltransferase
MTPERPIDLQPTLRGSLIHLRPLQDDDWPALFAVASDPEIWVQHPASDRYREDVFREFFRVAMATQSALIALDATDGRVIGSSRYAEYNPTAREIEIGWTFLARSHWGGRFNGEMKQLMLDHIFQFVDRVRFTIGPNNVRSQMAVQRIGGVLVGTQTVRGTESVIYAVSKPSTAVLVSGSTAR